MKIHAVIRLRWLYRITQLLCILVMIRSITKTDAFSHCQLTSTSARLHNLRPIQIRHYQIESKRVLTSTRTEPEMSNLKLSQSPANDNGNDDGPSNKIQLQVSSLLSKFSLLAPVWTSLAALYAIYNPSSAKVFGSPSVMQNALLVLMFAMGMAILPKDVSRAISNPKILATNAILCFGMVPLLALGLSQVLGMLGTSSSSTRVGLILLASVSGGQASNLFTLIAGGDVALSVICTLSTTLLGVLATPLLAQLLLGQTVDVKLIPVLNSVVSLVLVPLVTGLGLGQWLIPAKVHQRRIVPFMPVAGILATLILVAGGASSLSGNQVGPWQWFATALPSSLLCLLSGAFALQWINFHNRKNSDHQISETAKRALVVETLSKSPTLAYFLASRHFGTEAAAIPAAAMVTLAILGALVASLWSAFVPVEDSGDS